jgi:hypothetical protein
LFPVSQNDLLSLSAVKAVEEAGEEAEAVEV